jgi:hypothetical protein
MKLIRYQEGGYYLDVEEIAEDERPPMIEIPAYGQTHPRSARDGRAAPGGAVSAV